MANIRPLEVQTTGNQDLELLMQNIKKWAKVLEDNPLLDGRALCCASTGAGTVTINHGLGRQPLGWIVTDRSPGAGPPFPTLERISWDDKTIVINTSGICCFNLWVF